MVGRRDSQVARTTSACALAAGLGVGAAVLASCSAVVAPDTRRLYAESDAATDASFMAYDVGPITGTIAPSNVEAALLDMGTRDLAIEVPAVIDTAMCTASSADARVVRQRDGSEVCALLVRQLRIATTGTLRAFGWRPLVILASGDVEIAGTLDVSARGGENGAGGGVGGRPNSRDGSGIVRGLGGRAEGEFGDGGGAGGGLCFAGGRGGRGGGGEGGERSEGMMTTLEPLTGGGGGGLGPGGARPTPDGNFGIGGAGGGAVQVSARGRLRVTGRVLAGGGGGGGGAYDPRIANWGAGGGGGGGGGILLEATELRIEPTAMLLATGGSGGAGASSELPVAGGTDGREAATRVAGGVGGGMYGASGGASGGGSEGPGADGGASGSAGGNGGGGGGGAGCIVLRSTGGAARPDGATLSPSRGGVFTLPIHVR
jgi:hypothetical protein